MNLSDRYLHLDYRCQRLAFDGDVSDDLRTWSASLTAESDGRPESIILATAELITLRPDLSTSLAWEALDSADADLAAYSPLYDDNEFVQELGEEVLGNGLIIANRVRVEPAYRGRGYGPLLLAEALLDLGGGLDLAACEPAPFELDQDNEPEAWATEQARLQRLWSAFGFAPFKDRIWTVSLLTETITATAATLRSRVQAMTLGE